MKYIAMSLILACVSGCAPAPRSSNQISRDLNVISESTRYELKCVDVVNDPLAYDRTRGIYEITDKETGITYLGISGIGITERGRHQVGGGKTAHTVQDER
jgi:hypothetical protein